MQQKLFVLSDLDGTFLDHDTYSFIDSLSALKELISNSGSIAFVTSKTASEVLDLVEKLKESGVTTPVAFAVENGCGIYLPKAVFSLEEIEQNYPSLNVAQKSDYFVVSFGDADYQKIRLAVKGIGSETGKKVIGFGDMTVQELVESSGLPKEQAELAKIREFDEPYFMVGGEDQDYLKAKEITEKMGLSYHRGGRYAHVSLPQDKGRAAEVLVKLNKFKSPNSTSVGIGDAENDLSFLQVCDLGYLVKGKKEILAELSSNIQKIEDIGPKGFSEVIKRELATNNQDIT